MASTVNGYYCRTCADVELAKKGLDPAHPRREVSGGEVYVPPPKHDPFEIALGKNQPTPNDAGLGTRLNLHA
jgi:hypothetical protein